MRFLLAVTVVVVTGCLPPDKPAQAPTPSPGDAAAAAYAHVWLVENHILAGNATLSDGDAILMHGRKVELTTSSYRSPFQGSCDGATVDQRTRAFDDVAAEVDLSGDRRKTARSFGMTPTVTEYRLACSVKTTTPSLVLYVAGQRAMTCFSGVCYLMTPG